MNYVPPAKDTIEIVLALNMTKLSYAPSQVKPETSPEQVPKHNGANEAEQRHNQVSQPGADRGDKRARVLHNAVEVRTFVIPGTEETISPLKKRAKNCFLSFKQNFYRKAQDTRVI